MMQGWLQTYCEDLRICRYLWVTVWYSWWLVWWQKKCVNLKSECARNEASKYLFGWVYYVQLEIKRLKRNSILPVCFFIWMKEIRSESDRVKKRTTPVSRGSTYMRLLLRSLVLQWRMFAQSLRFRKRPSRRVGWLQPVNLVAEQPCIIRFFESYYEQQWACLTRRKLRTTATKILPKRLYLAFYATVQSYAGEYEYGYYMRQPLNIYSTAWMCSFTDPCYSKATQGIQRSNDHKVKLG